MKMQSRLIIVKLLGLLIEIAIADLGSRQYNLMGHNHHPPANF